MEPFVLQRQSLFTIASWMEQIPGLVAGITSKNGGVSKGDFESLNLGFHVGDILEDVCSNRMKVAESLHFPISEWVGAEQTHDIHIREVTQADRGRGAQSYDLAFKAVDGFFTRENDILLTLCFADCVPLFFVAPEYHMIGAAHAGWKGTVKEIGRHMVEAWKKEGINPDKIYAAIGPSICKECYIVDDYVMNFVKNILEDNDKKPYNLIRNGQYSLDLRELNRLILMRAGIKEENILLTRYCSSCDREQFFSHRRDSGHTGRMMSFIGWKESNEQR